MQGIQASFGTVIWIVAGVGLLAAVIAFASSRKQWEEYGRGRLVMDRDEPPGHERRTGTPAAVRERDEDIRALLEARNERRRRRGEVLVDVEAELRRLTVPQIDEDLRGEIRDLVLARNRRRTRAGQPPLDVEAEIAREIEDLRD